MGADSEVQYPETPNWNVSEIKAAMPARIFEHEPHKAFMVLGRDIVMAAALLFSMQKAELHMAEHLTGGTWSEFGIRSAVWLTYWWFQGLVFTGIWVIGHECAHGSFLPWSWACDLIGFFCHTPLWTPFFAWKRTHGLHHTYHALMTKDQHWIPHSKEDVDDNPLSDAPLYVLFSLIVQQLIGFPLYLIFNTSGPKEFPKGTGHFNPNAMFFTTPALRFGVVFSDLSMLAMAYIVREWVKAHGGLAVFMYYGIPTFLVSNWVTMIVYLHHTDPAVPHYREGAWTYTRGALATIDRDFLGWQGRFFLHDIAHFHIVHHLFPRMPFYRGEEATKYLKKVIGKDYNFSDKSVFHSLWTYARRCQFVDDHVDVAFYKEASGKSAMPYTHLVPAKED